MATMALPLRELSVHVQQEAVSAQKAYWNLAEEKVSHRRLPMLTWLKAWALNHAMGRLIESQQSLIGRLRSANVEQFPPDVFVKLAGDLDNVVALTNSFITEGYDAPSECVAIWSNKLETISEQNSHLDNFAESFHVAADEACTAVLADLAAKVTSDALVHN